MNGKEMYIKLQQLVDSKMLYWRKEGNRGMILHKINSKKDTKGFEVYTDLGTIALLELAKLHVPYDKIISIMETSFGINPEDSDSILSERLQKLLEFNSELISPYPLGHPYSYSAPHLAAVEITTHCNLSCNYCYANAGPHSKEYMNLAQIRHIFDELESLEIPILWITGGEPLLHPEIEEILKEAQNRGFYVIVATNGTPLYKNEKLLNIVKKYVDEIQIDLDGAKKETHEFYRGPNTFEKVIAVIKDLTKDKDRHRTMVVVGTTIGKRNLNEIPEIIKLVDSLNADYWVYGALIPVGRGRFVQWEGLSPNDLVKVYNLVLQGSKFAKKVTVLRSLAGVTPLDPPLERPTARCGAVNFQIQIHTNGDVYPCVFLREERFKLGNIFEKPLKEILSSPLAEYFRVGIDNPEQDVYNLVDSECRNCILYKKGYCNTFCKAIPRELYCTRDIPGSPLNTIYLSITKTGGSDKG